MTGAAGIVHTALALAALGLGLITLLQPKGTRWHRAIGMAYVFAMFGMNVTGLTIFEAFGGFGVFHVLSLVSLVTLLSGFGAAYLRAPKRAWMDAHAHLMAWSYVGLVAALFAEIAVRIPGVPFGWGVALPSFLIPAIAWLWIDRTLGMPARQRQSAPPHRERTAGINGRGDESPAIWAPQTP